MSTRPRRTYGISIYASRPPLGEGRCRRPGAHPGDARSTSGGEHRAARAAALVDGDPALQEAEAPDLPIAPLIEDGGPRRGSRRAVGSPARSTRAVVRASAD